MVENNLSLFLLHHPWDYMVLGLPGTLGEIGFGEVWLGESMSPSIGEKHSLLSSYPISLPPLHTEEEINWPVNLQLYGRGALMLSISGQAGWEYLHSQPNSGPSQGIARG